jgi:hypothetical protein
MNTRSPKTPNKGVVDRQPTTLPTTVQGEGSVALINKGRQPPPCPVKNQAVDDGNGRQPRQLLLGFPTTKEERRQDRAGRLLSDTVKIKGKARTFDEQACEEATRKALGGGGVVNPSGPSPNERRGGEHLFSHKRGKTLQHQEGQGAISGSFRPV